MFSGLIGHDAELTVTTVDTTWTTERAEQFLASLPASALRFAKLVVDADGDKPAEELRVEFHGELRGPTIALSRAVPRGVRRKWWPSGTEAPIAPRYDPEHPSWQKAIAYTMASENVTVFRAALARMAIAKGAAEPLGLTPGGTGKTSVSFTPDMSTLEGYTPVDLHGGSLPADDDQDEDDGMMQCHVRLQPYEADEQGNASHLDTGSGIVSPCAG